MEYARRLLVMACVVFGSTCAPLYAGNVVYRSLQVASIVAPALDVHSSLEARNYDRLYESSRLLQDSEGRAHPAKMIVAQSANAAIRLYALSLFKKKGGYWRVVGFCAVGAMDGVSLWAASHNYHMIAMEAGR